MNREEYTKYFNYRQPPGFRKVSVGILKLFEQKSGHSGEYYQYVNILEAIRDFLKIIPSKKYFGLVGEKQKRHREPSLLKNTKIEIRAFPIDEKLNHRWEFLAYDLRASQKYCWDKSKWISDQDQNKNQIYFNPSEVIDEFLALNLRKFPLTFEEKQKIIKFLEEYGPYFIHYYAWESQTNKDKEWYFWFFQNDFIHFKKAYETIKRGRPANFPHAKTPPRILEKLYNRKDENSYIQWQKEINDTQLWFNLCLSEGELPTIGKTPHNIRHLGRGIGIICNYLYQKCDKLLQCQHSSCGKFFFQSRQNQVACCPHHSFLLRVRRYKDKKESKQSI